MMNIFGLSVLLFYFKLSDGNGFWKNITKHIDTKRFNKVYTHGEARFQRFHGGKAEHIKNYVTSHLEEEKQDTVIIQIGGNDLHKGDKRDPSTITNIANNIIETAQICKARGVQHIFVGGVPIRKRRWTKEICKDLNTALEGQC